MQIGEEDEAVVVPLPLHPDDQPAEPEVPQPSVPDAEPVPA